MKKTLFLFLLVICLSMAKGQIVFQKTYGGIHDDQASFVLKTLDQGYLITGGTNSYGPVSCGTSSYLIKTNSNGDTLWTKYFAYLTGGTGTNRAIQTQDSGFIFYGNYTSGTSGYTHIFVLKCNASGDTLWSKIYGGNYDDFACDIYQTNDKGLIILGSTESFGDSIGFSSDLYVIKLDSIGNVLWSYAYGGNEAPWYEFPSYIQQTTDKGYFISSNSNSFSANHGNDFYAIKLDSVGTVLWSKTYGGAYTQWCNSAHQTLDNGFVLAGSTESFSGGSHIDAAYIVKTDSIGNVLWSKTYGTPQVYHSINNIKQTSNGKFIITGSFSDSLGTYQNTLFFKTDLNGDTIWSYSIGQVQAQGSNYGSWIDQTSDNGIILAGSILDNTSLVNDFYLIKTDSNGAMPCNQTKLPLIVNSPVTISTSVITYRDTANTVTKRLHSLCGNGSIVNDLCINTTSIYSNSQENIVSLYPNPTSDQFFIATNTNDKLNVDLYDVNGRHVFSKCVSDKENINISTLDNGPYTLTIKTANRVINKKLVILR